MFGGSRQHPAFVSVPGSSICTKCQWEFTSHGQEQGNPPLLAHRQSLIDQVLIVIAMSTKSLTRKILGQ